MLRCGGSRRLGGVAMNAGVRFASSILVALALLAAVSVQSALADPLDIVTLSVSGGVYSVTFSGADAGYSFQTDTSSMLALTTGGGWIPLGTDGKGTFGFVAGMTPNGDSKGHLVYIGRDTGLALHSTSIANFPAVCGSVITGTGDSTFGPVSFTVTVTDGGEPGTNDTFMIVVPELGYTRFGTLGGGDIQVHDKTCP